MRVETAGLLTTVQDSGRFGFQKYGVLASGAMDTVALRLANLLAGNQEGAAALEITLLGPKLVFEKSAVIALAGGNLSPAVDGVSLPLWWPVYIPAGKTLTFGRAVSGCRIYLAVAGGIHVPEVMGSRSTYLRAGMGGFRGRALQAGDVLETGVSNAWRDMASDEPVVLPWGASHELRPAYQDDPVLRVVRGPEYHRFDEESRRKLWTERFRVTPQSDRMGYRLEGVPLALAEPLDMVSSAVGAGTIQVPPEGNPIVLLADRQTAGGYPRIAHVTSVDLPLIAQVKPGGQIRFEEVSLEEAQELYVMREHSIAQFRQGLVLQAR
ncbi:biotin-dependent carboxyltransferase family protein [Paenibacillus melissococcoides]|uniref:Biotin-dependent carboxyltransferase family protein n=1 Tax=Paenibacillus melissococcoides TaxID=2912268 RepID=A0ABM9FWN2_9BACL|nr:biotin-dependent carboxyltransferase family protein [Paenibacillus melissococcoides]CAH8704917.1 biotin-dependent carboxyltransferase family protein [Paenibacillus melissococcoides]CAH8708144.1 biotin-dependent carboxyltransferase family protein [Paenibacillus melissococcoides]